MRSESQAEQTGGGVPHEAVLEVIGLKTYFRTEEGIIKAVDGVTFTIERGKIVALVGESGCGKSVTAFSILRLIQSPGYIEGGSMTLYPRRESPIEIADLDDKSERLYDLRGGKVSMIFQEPMTALSPVHSVGQQIVEAIRLHSDLSKEQARKLAIDMLGRVGIPGPEKRFHQYPHELSGGMRQRCVIAMALVCKPELLIADEPTTALDVTIQAQILGLIKDLQREVGCSTLFITHDLGVVAQIADEVAVMYLGKIVERGEVRRVLKEPRHPYTKGLLESIPGAGDHDEALPSIKGSVPSLTRIPRGCPFHPRCPFAERGRCDQGGAPELRRVGNRLVACVRAEELIEQGQEGALRDSE